MKKLFKRMLAGTFLAALFFNATFESKAQNNYYPTLTGNVGLNVPNNSTALSPLQVGTDWDKVNFGTAGYNYSNGYIGFNAAYSSGNWNLWGNGDWDNGGAAIVKEEGGGLSFICHPGLSVSPHTLTNAQFWGARKMYINPMSERIDFSTNLYSTHKVGIGTLPRTTQMEIKASQATAGQRNVLLKLSNDHNASGLNEPTIIFDNGTSTSLTDPYSNYGWALGTQVAGPGYFRIAKYTSSSSISEYFRIMDNGKTIIGDPATFTAGTSITTDDFASNYKLFVADGILTEKVKVAVKTTSNWADFVFEPSYKLKPLAEVEKFITENKHLPDVPSAEEMVSGGLDVAAMDAKLLQKIEELTLYMIDMKKENTQIKNQNENLVKEMQELKKQVELLKEGK